MNYRKHYDLLMIKAKNRVLNKNIYTEKHHIIPRSEGGSDDPDNLVKLLPREHFIAHWLLYRENPTMQRGFAFNMMSCDRLGRYRPSSRAYAEGKEAAAAAHRIKQTGRKVVVRGDELKYVLEQELDYYLEQGWIAGRKGRGIGRGRYWINNGVVEKLAKEVEEGWIKGRLSESRTKNKVAVFKDGAVKYVEDPTTYIADGWVLGNKKHNTPWKQLEGKTLTCPHCGKQGGYQGLKRWHFDNCIKRDYL